MSLIELKDVNKTYQGAQPLHVLKGINLDISRGEFVSIMGASGSGKSTLLNILGILDNYDEGNYYLAGRLIKDLNETQGARLRNELIGFVFQSFNLLNFKNALENVALPLEEQGNLDEAEIAARVDCALAAVELQDAAEKYPAEISGGMLKRAGLARAIVRRSDIVLYDEPTSGLDPVTSVTINRLIRKLNRSHGITSVVVTHDLQGALAFADRIVLLKDGRAAVDLPPAEFVKSENRHVREFLAAMKGV